MIVETESGGSFNAIGPKTRFNDRAYGPMQLMSATAKDLGVNRMDWKDNIRGGVKYLGQLIRDDSKILHFGGGCLQRWTR
jgi:soluble lytic murein transglycosylase-like protein